MPRTRFENLRVYILSEELADAVWSIVIKWDRFACNTVGMQLTRAADSVGANIAEGEGRGSYQDNRRFVKIARGSLQETQHWLRRAYRRKLLKPDEIEKLKTIIARLAPTLNAYMRSIGKSPPTANDK